jgi:hypothetical protein
VTRPTGIRTIQRMFRAAASVDVDKQDVRRYRAFVDAMIDDLAIAGRNSATWNGRDVIAPADLPITKGLHERMREFDELDVAAEVRELLRHDLRRPPSDVTFSEETENLLPEVFGGLSVVLARSFKVIDPNLGNPRTEDWDRAFALFRLMV